MTDDRPDNLFEPDGRRALRRAMEDSNIFISMKGNAVAGVSPGMAACEGRPTI